MIGTIEARKEKAEQVQRGLRIKRIREKELKLKKTELGKKIGVSGQFLGLVEEGNGNLMYRSIKKLKDLSGHSSDYILFGLDDTMFIDSYKYLENFSEEEIKGTIEVIKNISILIKKRGSM